MHILVFGRTHEVHWDNRNKLVNASGKVFGELADGVRLPQAQPAPEDPIRRLLSEVARPEEKWLKRDILAWVDRLYDASVKI